MRRYLRFLFVPIIALATWIGISTLLTEREITAHFESVRQVANRNEPNNINSDAMKTLPEPVQRYFAFAIPEKNIRYRVVKIAAEGEFRRPLTSEFEPTTATQIIATQTPAMMFAATTPVGCCLWARAYDFFADGHMEMRAKIVSTLTVMNENSTQALNRTSLRRWLLESPLYPVALLPGGPVRWEAIDDDHAKAIVSGFGLEESLIATFQADGRLVSFNAGQDGDLTTPYHGSGEHVSRSDYRLVAGMMIPYAFEISRIAKGKILPFWKGRITTIEFE
ncbi:hypothetical protein B4923_02170 [Brenneria roseae subsp. americana]|uniref:Uncharacterized protein n=1 Tax=Brenneria roseae subsp. americana TaxID=1508507 RepID=A0A2U1TZQ9_9GAMM|nr:DUF6544 family protein [Brenneria roseae]PWC14874.1 hypothetical protein B4923_02170 [Brenneria roseae subsp. americana]